MSGSDYGTIGYKAVSTNLAWHQGAEQGDTSGTCRRCNKSEILCLSGLSAAARAERAKCGSIKRISPEPRIVLYVVAVLHLPSCDEDEHSSDLRIREHALLAVPI
jgi:hypothetical protein